MADHQYNERVEATLVPSRLARRCVGLAALATLGLVCAIPGMPELRALAATWAAIAALHALGRLRTAPQLALERGGEVAIDGVHGRVRAGSFVAPWLVVVRWRPYGAWRDRSLLVAPDMLGADEFRRLRVLLRWGSG